MKEDKIMQNIELAIIYETYSKIETDYEKRETLKKDLTTLFSKIDDYEKVDNSVKIFNSSSKNALLEGLKYLDNCISIEMENNERNIMKNETIKEMTKKELKKKKEQIEKNIEELRKIYKKYNLEIN